jgi:hypothetical protein
MLTGMLAPLKLGAPAAASTTSHLQQGEPHAESPKARLLNSLVLRWGACMTEQGKRRAAALVQGAGAYLLRVECTASLSGNVTATAWALTGSSPRHRTCHSLAQSLGRPRGQSTLAWALHWVQLVEAASRQSSKGVGPFVQCAALGLPAPVGGAENNQAAAHRAVLPALYLPPQRRPCAAN